MRRLRAIGSGAALMAGLAAASCSTWSFNPAIHGTPISARRNLAAAQAAAAPHPMSFVQYLGSEYAAFAAHLLALGDLVDTDYFARKSLAASHGTAVPPENNANWAIPLETPDGFRTTLSHARTQLITVLGSGATTRAPAIAARAQARYDCWTERMEDDWQHAQNGPCRREFEAAMAELGERPARAPAPTHPAPPRAPAPAPVTVVNVYFDFNKSSLTREARQIVQQLAGELKARGGVTVSIVGKTDLAGSDRYNLALSKRRAEAVEAELAADGIAKNRMRTSWTGERNPPVKTTDGVREPRNRVVEVTMH
jgi:OmpA-OmpF porin, OOP family